MGDLSPHFSRSEFRDHRTGALPEGYPVPELVQLLERIRERVGRPLRVVSGYRSRETNRSIGGVVRSQHLVGRAADLPSGMVPVAVALAAGARGIGIRDGHAVHVDVRRSAKPVTWHYD